ncbi:hypothetical protein [Modestobacter sp. VKM Ac-2984]|uniref:hypothetical protein n=1 Tax=Modestobacter sp. VKM Ac-2984 TaxID=3004138 RepID=UPI0022AAF77D|nr:hypothetical protein [Modestobacter sp. VKM Ac-2984]MCZ2815325.1 hypothetical protein [Modestobacter sp. VKM Ac-2984]
MWLFLTRRLRMWVILTVVAPLATKVLRALGQTLEKRTGPSAISKGLLKAGDLGERARVKLGGKRRR